MDIRLGRKKMMIVNDYQREAIKTDKWFDHDPTSRLLKAHIGLNLAATKLYDLIKRPLFRNESLDKAAVAEQLGDVAWYVAIVADAIGCKLEDILQRNIDKIQGKETDNSDMVYEIKRVGGHYEAYINGSFYCSGDTITEVAEEVEGYLEEDREEEQLEHSRKLV